MYREKHLIQVARELRYDSNPFTRNKAWRYYKALEEMEKELLNRIERRGDVASCRILTRHCMTNRPYTIDTYTYLIEIKQIGEE